MLQDDTLDNGDGTENNTLNLPVSQTNVEAGTPSPVTTQHHNNNNNINDDTDSDDDDDDDAEKEDYDITVIPGMVIPRKTTDKQFFRNESGDNSFSGDNDGSEIDFSECSTSSDELIEITEDSEDISTLINCSRRITTQSESETSASNHFSSSSSSAPVTLNDILNRASMIRSNEDNGPRIRQSSESTDNNNNALTSNNTNARTIADIFPAQHSVFEACLSDGYGSSCSSPSPSPVSSREKWPVSKVMVVNVPASLLRGSGPNRKMGTLVRSTKGLKYMKLLELLSHTCFNASNDEPPEDDNESGGKRKKKNNNKRGRPNNRSNVDFSNIELSRAQQQGRRRRRRRTTQRQEEENANASGEEVSAPDGMTEEGRRTFDIITASLLAGSLGGRGEGEGSSRRGEAIDVDQQCPPGAFCHTLPDDTEIFVPCTSQYVEAVRSEGEHAKLMALRFWFVIRDPSFDATETMENIIREHKKGIEKSLSNRNPKTISNRYDSPVNWKAYRNIQDSKGYGRLLDCYFGGRPLSSRTETTIAGFPPEVAFAALGDQSLVRGLDEATADQIRASQKNLANYLEVQNYKGPIKLTGLLYPRIEKGIRELDRIEITPQNLCEIVAPRDIVNIDSETDTILPPGIEEASGETRDGYTTRIRSIIDSFNNNDSVEGGSGEGEEENGPGSSFYMDRLMAAISGAEYQGFDASTDRYVEWDSSEVNEIETSNKALSHKHFNHEKRTELRRKYMVENPTKYIEEMKKFTSLASARLITDLKNFKEEKDSWYDSVVKILEYGESLRPSEFWPAFATTCDNLGVFGNAMVQEYTSFIHAFRIAPGWKPRDLQKYLVISLNVLEYEFALHLHALLSGAAQTGKSFLLEKLVEMRVAQTVEKITTLTEASLTSDPRAFNYKTVVMEEASGWCLGMDQDGRPTKMQSSVLKDILSSCTANSLRCNWKDGETSRAATFSVMMTNFIFASNWGYPPKKTPLVSRLMVEDVAEDEGKKIPISDIAFSLCGQAVDHLNERICKEKKVEQYLHLIVELFILAEVIDPNVNLDIPLFMMDDVFNYLHEHHDIALPSPRLKEQILKVCRVLTIQNAIRTAYFTETGQLKYQYRMREERDKRTGEKTGRMVVETNRNGEPIKKPFSMKTIVEAIAPRLFCTEDIFAYAMTMMERHIVPKLEADVVNAFAAMVASSDQEHRVIRSRTIDPSTIIRYNENGNDDNSAEESAVLGDEGAISTIGAGGAGGGGERIWAKVLDPDYYVIRFNSMDSFYKETASNCERGICETTVRTIVSELKERMISVELKPNLIQFESLNAEGNLCLMTGIDPISKKNLEQREKKSKKKIPFIRIERAKKGYPGFEISIAKELVVAKEQPLSPSSDNGSFFTQQHRPVRRRHSNYHSAMKDALVYALSYHETRERDIVLSRSYESSGKVYNELLDVIHVEPCPRVLYREQRLVPGLLGPLLIYYADCDAEGESKIDTYVGKDADVVVVDGNFELEVAKNHAKWIGVEFDYSVVPTVQEEEIKRTRERNPDLFVNTMIQYPEQAKLIVDAQTVKSDFVKNRIKNAKSYKDIEEMLNSPFMNARKLSSYYKKQTESSFDSVFENAAMESVAHYEENKDRYSNEDVSKEDVIYQMCVEILGDEAEEERLRKQTLDSINASRGPSEALLTENDIPLEDYDEELERELRSSHPDVGERLDPQTAEALASISDYNARMSNLRHQMYQERYRMNQAALEAASNRDQMIKNYAKSAVRTVIEGEDGGNTAGNSNKRKRRRKTNPRMNAFRQHGMFYHQRQIVTTSVRVNASGTSRQLRTEGEEEGEGTYSIEKERTIASHNEATLSHCAMLASKEITNSDDSRDAFTT